VPSPSGIPVILTKEDNISVNDAIEDLNDRFSNEGDKLSDTEKTALNVITVLLLVLHSSILIILSILISSSNINCVVEQRLKFHKKQCGSCIQHVND
jgi:hypothetical protein